MGGDIIYTVTVTNLGALMATNIVASDLLPENVMLVSAVSSDGYMVPLEHGDHTHVVSLYLDSLGAGQTATMTLDVMPMEAGTLTNTVEVFNDIADPAAGNNSASVDVIVSP